MISCVLIHLSTNTDLQETITVNIGTNTIISLFVDALTAERRTAIAIKDLNNHPCIYEHYLQRLLDEIIKHIKKDHHHHHHHHHDDDDKKRPKKKDKGSILYSIFKMREK